jgi:hypothetical protein
VGSGEVKIYSRKVTTRKERQENLSHAKPQRSQRKPNCVKTAEVKLIVFFTPPPRKNRSGRKNRVKNE